VKVGQPTIGLKIRNGRHLAQERAMEASDIGQKSGARPTRPSRCLAPGCACQDARIVSHRRARFFAHLAEVSGETADRVIQPEADWTLPPIEDTIADR
jgi:hypothetical protein